MFVLDRMAATTTLLKDERLGRSDDARNASRYVTALQISLSTRKQAALDSYTLALLSQQVSQVLSISIPPARDQTSSLSSFLLPLTGKSRGRSARMMELVGSDRPCRRSQSSRNTSAWLSQFGEKSSEDEENFCTHCIDEFCQGTLPVTSRPYHLTS